MVLKTEPGWAACKANALTPVLTLQPEVHYHIGIFPNNDKIPSVFLNFHEKVNNYTIHPQEINCHLNAVVQCLKVCFNRTYLPHIGMSLFDEQKDMTFKIPTLPGQATH